MNRYETEIIHIAEDIRHRTGKGTTSPGWGLEAASKLQGMVNAYPMPHRQTFSNVTLEHRLQFNNYMRWGTTPSPVILALLQSHIMGFYATATESEWWHLHALLDYIYAVLPGCAHGSVEAVELWLNSPDMRDTGWNQEIEEDRARGFPNAH